MSTYDIVQLSGDVVLVTEREQFNLRRDGEEMLSGVHSLFASNPRLRRLVVDSRLPIYDLDDIVVGLNLAAPYFQQMNLEKLIVIGSEKLQEVAVEGMGTDTFGNLPTYFFFDIEEALAEARN